MTVGTGSGLSELDLVQNPAIGALLIWHYTLGYQEDGAEAAPMLPAFLVLPMLLHRQTFEAVTSTRKASGLTLFAAKFDREREVLLELQGRTRMLRQLSLQSIGVASTSRLVRIDHGLGSLRGRSLELLEAKKPLLPERLKGFPAAGEKIGYWFSKLGVAHIASTLRIAF